MSLFSNPHREELTYHNQDVITDGEIESGQDVELRSLKVEGTFKWVTGATINEQGDEAPVQHIVGNLWRRS